MQPIKTQAKIIDLKSKDAGLLNIEIIPCNGKLYFFLNLHLITSSMKTIQKFSSRKSTNRERKHFGERSTKRFSTEECELFVQDKWNFKHKRRLRGYFKLSLK